MMADGPLHGKSKVLSQLRLKLMKKLECSIICAGLFLCLQCNAALLAPTSLTCEYVKDPSVVDVVHPRLGWVNLAEEGDRGQFQSACEIRVAGSKHRLPDPDLWDSGRIASWQSTRVVYQGKVLHSQQPCWWQVRVWDKEGKVSEWSRPAFWRMGLLHRSDWKAQWIGAPWQDEDPLPRPEWPGKKVEDFGPPAPMLRKTVHLDKEIDQAVAYVTGLGYFEFYVNGQRVREDVLVPNQTNYGKRPKLPEFLISVEDNFREYKVMYLAYDITDKLTVGDNAFGSILGNGFYDPSIFWCEGYGTPRFLGQIHICHKDGTETVVVSDTTWKATKSPIVKNMLYYGEIYDARLEQEAWCTPGYDDSSWQQAAKRSDPFGKLAAHTTYPDRIVERLKPVSIKKLVNGNTFVDFGVEVSGWVCLTGIKAPAGHRIDLRFNSNLYSGDNSYICSGRVLESYAPRFNWFVFSGVELSNWPGELRPDQITAEVVHTQIEKSAVFETSNQLFNDINRIWRRSQTDNMHGGIASDCPHRERNAYTGDGQVACTTVMHNYDARSFYHKWIQDILGAQNPKTGYVPNGAPWEPGCGGGVAWGAAMCIIPWEFYLHYGALDILQDNCEGMKGYVRYMQKWVDEDGIMFSQILDKKKGTPLKWFNLGDWSMPGKGVPDNLVHTFYFWRCADITAKAARRIGHDEEAEVYADLAEKTRQAFQKRFYQKDKGSYGTGGANIFALEMGVPRWQQESVISALKANIKANKGHLDTGIFGTQFFFEVLTKNGLHDLAYNAMNKRTQPSFGFWLEQGATTTREDWDSTGSHNHPMFGGALTWFYRSLAGMNADPEHPGYEHVIFKPHPVKDLSYVKYVNNTVRGKAGVVWRQKNGEFTMRVIVPVGSTATVYVPAQDQKQVYEGGVIASKAREVRFLRQEGDYAMYKVSSGSYVFSVSSR